MASIVTRVLDSDLLSIGQNIADLSDNPADPAPGSGFDEQVKAVRLSYKDSGGVGAAQMQNICNSLSMSEITEAGGTWTLGPQVGPGAAAATSIAGMADIKFVFEGENEKIIVVPNKNALAFARQEPPLKEGGYVDDLAREHALVVKGEVEDRLDEAGAELGPQKDAILALIQAAIDEKFEESDSPLNTLFEQLGSYTCRQCG